MHKRYGEHVVLGGVDFDVPAGTVFALLGPNGAGKTTTVSILSTLDTADAGTLRVAGVDVRRNPRDVRRHIAVTGQFAAVDNTLTGAENLRLIAGLHHLSRRDARSKVDGLLDRFALTDVADRRASTYSGGMRRRLDLATSLVGDPSIVFLDEPTTGLDPRSRREMWSLVRELVDAGVTIFLTTQYLDEADRLADHIAILDGGRIAGSGTADELTRAVPGGHLELRFTDTDVATRAALVLTSVAPSRTDTTLRVDTDGAVRDVRHVLGLLEAADVDVESMALHTPDLDDVFFSLTGGRPASDTRDLQEAIAP
nr:ATP-binding cassette domain-containing protein [Rhodococcus sp. HNM0569]